MAGGVFAEEAKKAIKDADIEALRKLIDKGLDVNVTDKDGFPLLVDCIEAGNFEAAQLLIKKGARVNYIDKNGDTPIFFTLIMGEYTTPELKEARNQILQLLLNSGASPNHKGLGGRTPLSHAMVFDNNDAIDILLNHPTNKADPNLNAERGISPAHIAMQKGNTKASKILQDKQGVIPKNARNKALEEAVKLGRAESVVELLKQYSFDKSFLNNLVKQAIETADIDTLRALVNKGAVLNEKIALKELQKHFESKSKKLGSKLCLEQGKNILKIVDGIELVNAIINKEKDKIEKLLKAGADLGVINSQHKTSALIEAAKQNNKELIDLLLEKGANIYLVDGKGNNYLKYANKNQKKDIKNTSQKALEEAVKLGKSESVVKLLKQYSFDISFLNNLVKQAIGNADIITLKALVNKGAALNKKIALEELQRQFESKSSSISHQEKNILKIVDGIELVNAVINKEKYKIERLLIADADLGVINSEHKTTVLIEAIKQNNGKLAMRLIQAGADINLVDSEGNSALMHACKNNMQDICKELITKNADTNIKNIYGETALVFAIPNTIPKNIDIVVNLLENKADVNAINRENKITPLMNSIMNNLKVIVPKLIEAGAKVDAQDQYGKTALMYAIEKGDKNSVKALIDAGANVDITDSKRKTALMYAIEKGDKDTIKALMDAGANVDITDSKHKTALMYAILKRDYDSIKALIDASNNINIIDLNSRTALLYAVEGNDIVTTKLLLEKNADIHIKGTYYRDGYTGYGDAYELAKRKGHDYIAGMLFEHEKHEQLSPEKKASRHSQVTDVARYLLDTEKKKTRHKFFQNALEHYNQKRSFQTEEYKKVFSELNQVSEEEAKEIMKELGYSKSLNPGVTKWQKFKRLFKRVNPDVKNAAKKIKVKIKNYSNETLKKNYLKTKNDTAKSMNKKGSLEL